jgi:hypothetical protein
MAAKAWCRAVQAEAHSLARGRCRLQLGDEASGRFRVLWRSEAAWWRVEGVHDVSCPRRAQRQRGTATAWRR